MKTCEKSTRNWNFLTKKCRLNWVSGHTSFGFCTNFECIFIRRYSNILKIIWNFWLFDSAIVHFLHFSTAQLYSLFSYLPFPAQWYLYSILIFAVNLITYIISTWMKQVVLFYIVCACSPMILFVSMNFFDLVINYD